MAKILKTICKNDLNHSAERGYFFENREYRLMYDAESGEFWIERDDNRILWNLISSKTYRRISGIWDNKSVAVRMFNKFANGEIYA